MAKSASLLHLLFDLFIDGFQSLRIRVFALQKHVFYMVNRVLGFRGLFAPHPACDIWRDRTWNGLGICRF